MPMSSNNAASLFFQNLYDNNDGDNNYDSCACFCKDVQCCGLEVARRRASAISKLERGDDTHIQTKLELDVQIRDLDRSPHLVITGMTRYQRILMARLLYGILPLEVKTGRFQNVLRERRYCWVYGLGPVEDKIISSSSAPKPTPAERVSLRTLMPRRQVRNM